MAQPFYDPETYTAHKSIGCWGRRLNNLMTPQAEALFAEEDLTFSHWIALMSLRDRGSATCADLSRHMSYDSGAITRLVDQLEKRGLVERVRSTSDRRVVNLSLTAAGRDMAKSLSVRVVEYWNDMLEDFTREEATLLISMLSRLVTRMEAEPLRAKKARVA
jgi:DNA-binding MarR family transcriptional regulator